MRLMLKKGTVIVPDMSGGASRPAQGCRRSIRKELNSNYYVMYIYMTVVHKMSRTHAVYLYSSVKLSNC